MDDDEDSVVHEVDVFLTRASEDTLYLFQYPSRSARRPFDGSSVVEVKAKPSQKKVELSIALDTHKSTYDADRGSQFAVNARESGSKSCFESDFMDRQTFQTTQTKHSAGKYFVGFLKDGRLHLSVISAILQLHSSFSYMDADDKTSDEFANKEEEEAKPVTVKFARPETDRAKKAREKSFSYLLKKLGEEPWVPLNYHPVESEFSEKRLTQLIGRSDEVVYNWSSSSDEYIKSVLAKTCTKEPTPSTSSDTTTSESSQTKTLTDQIQTLLLNVKWLLFSDLLRFFGQELDAMAALRALQHVAVLIRGCWVVKSEFLYPKNTVSSLSGISSELLCRARDLILWQFTQSYYVTRDFVVSLIKLPDEDLKQMLSQIACYEPNKGWKFAMAVDEMFDKKYPEVMQRQKLLWDARYSSLAKTLKLKGKGNEIENILRSPVRKRGHLSLESESESHAERLLPSSSSIGNVTIKMEVDTDNNVPATSTFETELASFVSERLTAYNVITVSELRRHLNQKLSQSAPGHILCSGVTDALLESTLRDIGAVCISTMWPLGMTDESIYGNVMNHDGKEKLRRCFLGLFREICKLRKPAIKKGIEKALGEPLTDDDFSLLQRVSANISAKQRSPFELVDRFKK